MSSPAVCKLLSSGLEQGSAVFLVLRTGFSLALFCETALNNIMDVWHLQIYYNLLSYHGTNSVTDLG